MLSWFKRKELPVAEATNNNNGGVDVKPRVDGIGPSVAAAIATAVKPIAAQQKTLADTLAQLPPAPAATGKDAAKKDEGAKTLTAEDVTRIVGDQLKAAQTSQAQTA